MTHPRAPGAASERSRRIVAHLLGAGGLGQLSIVILTLVGLGWFTDSLFEWLTDIGRWWQGQPVADWWPPHRIIGIGFFLLLMSLLLLQASRAARRYRPRVACEQHPGQVKALILYLSPLREPHEDQKLAAIRSRDDFNQELGEETWRMPIEAIYYHRPRLQQVILISSSGKDGSRRQTRQFQQLCRQLFGDVPRVQDIGEHDSRYGHGLDFNNVEQITAASDDAHRLLEQQKLSNHDILIDITGGQKTNSIAGAAVALAEGRAIQYVACDRDSDTYQVIAYDVTYDQ